MNIALSDEGEGMYYLSFHLKNISSWEKGCSAFTQDSNLEWGEKNWKRIIYKIIRRIYIKGEYGFLHHVTDSKSEK